MTIKSVCDEIRGGLCKVPPQNLAAASIVHAVQDAVDPKGTKQLNTAQVKAVVTFLKVVADTT